MLRRAIAIAVALLMVLPMLAACQATAPATTTAPAEATKDPATEAPEATGTPPAAKTLCPYTGETEIYKKAVGNIEIKWELVPSSDFDTKAKLYLNSGEIPDIFWYKSPDLMKDYSTSGLFLDLNKYKDYMPNWIAETKKIPGLLCYQTSKGEQFIMHGVDNDFPEETFIANKTVLDSLGIAVPTNLAELEVAMAQVKEKDPTVTPFHTMWGIGYYMGIFGTSLNARTGMYFDLADKTWKHAVLSPESKYKELVTLLADYYAKGYFNAEFATMSSDQTKQLMASNKWAFTFTYAGEMNNWYDTQLKDPLPVDLVPLLPLAAEGVKPNIWCAFVSDSPYWGYSLNVNVKNPELACSYIDVMLGDEVSTAFQWGIEGTSYTVDANGKKKWIPEFLDKGGEASSALGIWNILAPRYITKRDESAGMQRSSAFKQELITMMVEAIKSGKVDSYYYRSNPTFTDEETEELSAIMTPISTKISEGESLFILGKRPISEWDAFIAEVKALGNLERAVEIYNKALQSFDRIQGIDRDYVTP